MLFNNNPFEPASSNLAEVLEKRGSTSNSKSYFNVLILLRFFSKVFDSDDSCFLRILFSSFLFSLEPFSSVCLLFSSKKLILFYFFKTLPSSSVRFKPPKILYVSE